VRALKWMLIPFLLLCWLVSGAANAGPAPPVCLPRVQWKPALVSAAIPAGVSTRFDTYAVWICDMPSGYVVSAWLFTTADVATTVINYARGLWTKSDADADCAKTCVDPTPSEATFIQQLISVNKPPTRVAFNGSNTKRSVYAANADGTLNPSPIAGSSVAVAGPCDSGARIPRTTYYSVAGQADASKPGAVLGKVYAVCVVTLSNGAN